jgi:hypothetical protein
MADTCVGLAVVGGIVLFALLDHWLGGAGSDRDRGGPGVP